MPCIRPCLQKRDIHTYRPTDRPFLGVSSSVGRSVRPSIRPSVRPSVRNAFVESGEIKHLQRKKKKGETRLISL